MKDPSTPKSLPQGERAFTAETMGESDTQKSSGTRICRTAPDGREFIWNGKMWVSLSVFDAEDSEYQLNGHGDWRS